MERECILVLLHYGASYNIKNQQGKTALETHAGQMNYHVYEEFPVAAKLKALRIELKDLEGKRKELTKELMAIRAKRTAQSKETVEYFIFLLGVRSSSLRRKSTKSMEK
jgi:hypothetical protein